MDSFIFGGNTGETQDSLARKRRIAEAMMANAPQAHDAWSGLANAGAQIAAALIGRGVDKGESDLATNRQQTVASALAALRGTPEWKNPDNPQETLIPQKPGDKQSAYSMLASSNDPQLSDMAMKLQLGDMQSADEENTWQKHFGMQNDADMERMKAQQAFQAEQQARSLAAQRDLAQSRIDDRNPIAVMTPDGPRYVPASAAVGQHPYSPRQGNSNLPVSMQKAEDADLEAVDLSRNIEADITAQKDALDKGAFKVDPMSRAGYKIGQMTGMGGPETAAFGSFQATLEKLRNDSLRLNKGVQTEGDAVRAWNELFSAMGQNDLGTVSRRLGEIGKINQRAASEAKRRIDIRRERNGTDPFDWESFTPMGTVIDGGAKPAAAPTPSSAPVDSQPPSGVDPTLWQHMTPQERALWK